MRRRPVEPPHLSTTENKANLTNSSRRRGLVPSQTTLSVQNIPDYSTAAGSAMANEEFRRLRLAIKAVEDKAPEIAASPAPIAPQVIVAPSSSEASNITNITEVTNILDIPETMESGFVYLNRLPHDPYKRPSPDYAANDYKYEYFNYTPSNGYYGWYCYGIIRYKFKLPEPRAYLLNLIDIHDIQVGTNQEELKIQAIRDYVNNNVPDWIDKTDDEQLAKIIKGWYDTFWSTARGFEKQEAYPEDEPIVYSDKYGNTENAIIVRGVYKPDIDTYRGYQREQDINMIDPIERIARTNLIFYYTLHRKV